MIQLSKTLLVGAALSLVTATSFAQDAAPATGAASAPAAPVTPATPVPATTTAPAAAVAPAAAASAAAPASTDAAREALSKKEGDVDQAKLLKETLTATDKQYSLIRQGNTAVTYDLTYSYIGQQTIDVSFSDTGEINNFGLTNTRGHTLTNTVSADYGVADNLTANFTVPLVSRYSQTETSTGVTNAFGDISLGARYQPFSMSRDLPTLTTTASLHLPTGRSPFKTIEGQGLGTGAGYASMTVGANASKIVDPVAIFGSLNLTVGAPAKHLSQVRDGRTLTEVRPGPALSWGAGFAYALSYNISTSISFQETVAGRSKLTLVTTGSGPDSGTETVKNTTSQTSAVLNMGLGVRTSPLTTVNFTVGIGLTSDTPDFTFGMNMPLHF